MLAQCYSSIREQTFTLQLTRTALHFEDSRYGDTANPSICGETHWLADCPYLVPEKFIKGWNEDAFPKDRRAWVNKTIPSVKPKMEIRTRRTHETQRAQGAQLYAQRKLQPRISWEPLPVHC